MTRFRRRAAHGIVLAAACLAGTFMLSACARAQGVAHPDLWPQGDPQVLIRPDIERRIDGILAGMTLEDKVGQMIQADVDSVRPEDLAHYRLGSILAGGFAAPGHDVHSGLAAWRDMVAAFHEASVAHASPGHPAIPILFGIDAVHGNAKLQGATIFPHNVGLGATHDPELVRRIGSATAEEVAAAGIDWIFAPTVAVARDPRWGRAFESYSDDPAEVAAFSRAMIEGIEGRPQAPDFLSGPHTLASLKHFLGDGATRDGRDQGDAPIAETALRDIDAQGYLAGVAAGAGSVMASYSSWQGVKMHDNHSLITGVLKDRLHFNGFVVGDWNAQEEIPGCTRISCPAMINAGIDMVMAPDGWRDFYRNTIDQVHWGMIPMARIDDAVRRILRVKAWSGLLDKTGGDAWAPSPAATFGGAAHRALAREAVRESLVLLKNNGNVLPLRGGGKLLVAGPGADSLAMQCGGWTVDWQGTATRNADIPTGTTIFAGIEAAANAAGGSAVLSADGSFTERPDAAVVVFGEHPYAEFQGDRENLIPYPHDDRPFAIMQRLRAAGIPVVSVLLSGRPLFVAREMNASDAFVAAWLPGMAGEGVADLLLAAGAGAAAHDFSGRLSFPWPKTAMPVRSQPDGSMSGALFPRGYGLGLHDQATVPALDETPHIAPGYAEDGSFFHAGHPTAPWSVYVSDQNGEVRMTLSPQASPDRILSTSRTLDGISLTWTGAGPGSWRIGGRPVDLGAAEDGKAVSLTYRLDAAPTAPVRFGLGCGGTCFGGIDVTGALGTVSGSAWRHLVIPLSCLAKAGADLHAVDAPVVLATEGAVSITLQSATIEAAASGAACPPAGGSIVGGH